MSKTTRETTLFDPDAEAAAQRSAAARDCTDNPNSSWWVASADELAHAEQVKKATPGAGAMPTALVATLLRNAGQSKNREHGKQDGPR